MITIADTIIKEASKKRKHTLDREFYYNVVQNIEAIVSQQNLKSRSRLHER